MRYARLTGEIIWEEQDQDQRLQKKSTWLCAYLSSRSRIGLSILIWIGLKADSWHYSILLVKACLTDAARTIPAVCIMAMPLGFAEEGLMGVRCFLHNRFATEPYAKLLELLISIELKLRCFQIKSRHSVCMYAWGFPLGQQQCLYSYMRVRASIHLFIVVWSNWWLSSEVERPSYDLTAERALS